MLDAWGDNPVVAQTLQEASDALGEDVAKLIHEFHQHRIGATIEDAEYAGADTEFFDDIVKGTLARSEEIDAAIITRLARGITTGSILEYTNKEILADALSGRQKF